MWRIIWRGGNIIKSNFIIAASRNDTQTLKYYVRLRQSVWSTLVFLVYNQFSAYNIVVLYETCISLVETLQSLVETCMSLAETLQSLAATCISLAETLPSLKKKYIY